MSDSGERLPLPIVAADGAEAYAATFGDTDLTVERPLDTAALWWLALSDPVQNRNALDHLVLNPADWGDYTAAAGLIATRSIMQDLIDCDDDPNIKYAKFINYGGTSAGIGFADAALDDVQIVIVIRPTEDRWYVWGLSHNWLPSRAQIRGEKPLR